MDPSYGGKVLQLTAGGSLDVVGRLAELSQEQIDDSSLWSSADGFKLAEQARLWSEEVARTEEAMQEEKVAVEHAMEQLDIEFANERDELMSEINTRDKGLREVEAICTSLQDTLAEERAAFENKHQHEESALDIVSELSRFLKDVKQGVWLSCRGGEEGGGCVAMCSYVVVGRGGRVVERGGVETGDVRWSREEGKDGNTGGVADLSRRGNPSLFHEPQNKPEKYRTLS